MVWRWLERIWRPYRAIDDWGVLVEGRERRVQIVGRIEGQSTLRDPLTGDPCIALEYRAWPPATTLGMDGATAHAGRAYQISARQMGEFVLTEGGVRVLVRSSPGEDVLGLHQRLLDRYGVGLRAETEVVVVGQSVQVAGEVIHRSGQGGTPHRELPYHVIIQADRIRLV